MKRYKIIQVLTLVGILLFNIHAGYAQEKRQLTGKVVSSLSHGQPLAGAVVSVSGTSNSVQTDSEGNFVLEAPDLAANIEIWSPGYYTYKQPIMGRTQIVASLIPVDKYNYSETLLKHMDKDELQNKSSAINNIDKSSFAKGSITVEQAIYNSLPGLRTVMKSGAPGEGGYLNSRGIKSFVGSSAPLIVINNVPYVSDMEDSYVVNGYSNSILNGLNPNDIQNVTYLRGGDASIYGSLGSNGVILIETDNASDRETKVSFIGQYGVSSNTATLPVMKADDYKAYIGNIALTHYPDPADVLSTFPFLKDDPNYYYKFMYDGNTDWQDKIYTPALVTDNLLKIKGGDAIAMYDLSLGYLNQSGTVDGSNLSRYHARLNANVNISREIDMFASISMAYLTNDYQEQGMLKQTNPILAALAKSPLKSPYEEDQFNHELPNFSTIKDMEGKFYENDRVSNPLAVVKTTELKAITYDVIMNGGFNYTVNPDLKLTGMVGFFYNFNNAKAFIPGVTIRSIMPLSDGLANNTVRNGVKETQNIYFNLNGSWKKKINDIHNLKASLGWQMMQTHREFDLGTGMNTASDYYRDLGNVSVVGRNDYGYIDLWNWMNFYGKAEYNYNNLIYGGLNLSYDGASSTGPDATRFYVYPSLSAAWNIKNMPGLSNSVLLNKLTLRAEYSLTGNSNYASMMSEYYFINQTFQQLSGIVRQGIANTKIVPEKTATINLGLDVAVLNNAVDLTVDVYQSKTTDVILDKMISPVFGFNSTYDNLAEIQNTGVEVGLQGYVFKNKNWSWLVGGTIAQNKNEILSLGGESDKIIELADGSALISRKGESAYSFYGYKTNGVFASAQEAIANGGLTTYAGASFGAGDVRFVDEYRDGVIDQKDRVILGDANPNVFGRFYTSVSFKDFTLTANFAYSQGNKAYNAVRRSFESVNSFENQLISVNRRWMSENQVTDIPRAVYGDPMNNSRFSDRWIEDASFVKLKELTLSYNFKNLFNIVRGGTVYVTGENLATWTKYLGLDPEFSYSYSSSMQGFDYAKVAQPMNVKFGVNLQF